MATALLGVKACLYFRRNHACVMNVLALELIVVVTVYLQDAAVQTHYFGRVVHTMGKLIWFH